MDESDNVKIRRIIAAVPAVCCDAHKIEAAVEEFTCLCNLYQEKRQLLDKHMADYIALLLGHIDITASPSTPIVTRKADHACQLLAFLCKVRREKVMLTRLPHTVDLLAPVLTLLERIMECPSGDEPMTNDAPHTAMDDVTRHSGWQTEYVLLLWLTMLVGNPFDLQRFGGDDDRSVIDRVHRCAVHYAHVQSRSCGVASRLIAKLMDTPLALLESTMNNCIGVVTASKDDIDTLATTNIVVKHLAVLADIHKAGIGRDKLTPFAQPIHDCLSSLPREQCSTIIRKMVVKIEQRVALVLLPPRQCKWRYTRGGRSLADNLRGDRSLASDRVDDGEEEDDDDFDVPPLVEAIVGGLLTDMNDGYTIVRWSIAKGIGRVCARIPKEMADDVIMGVITRMLNFKHDESVWHCGCYSLAELARRGCLLPARLDAVASVACTSLHFSQQRGRHAIGSNVRDAGAYLCWALARAFSSTHLATHVQSIATQLVVVSLADRNVGVRRAAQSAFQELVGRHRGVAHAEVLMERCDYMQVNNTRRCYTQLMTIVWPMEDELLEHLLSTKLQHWHENIRQLTAEALGLLATSFPALALEHLPVLLADCLTIDIFKRHGSMLTVRYIVDVLLQSKLIPVDVTAEVVALPLTVFDQHASLLTGTASDLNHVALFDLMHMLLSRRAIISDDEFKQWRAVAMKCIGDVRPSVRLSASTVIGRQFAWFDVHAALLDEWLQEHIGCIRDGGGTETTRIVHIWVIKYATGVLPPTHHLLPLLHTTIGNVLSTVPKHEERWAEARQEAVIALSEMNDVKHGIPTASPLPVLLAHACRDYTRDERGDIGRIVRQTAATAVANHLVRGGRMEIDAVDAIPVLITLAVEPLDSVRLAVVDGMCDILSAPNAESQIAQYGVLYKVFVGDDAQNDRAADELDGERYRLYREKKMGDNDEEEDEEEENDGSTKLPDALTEKLFVWRRAEDAYERLAPLLDCPEYLKATLRGFVVAAGGLGESTQRAATDMLVEHVQQWIDAGKLADVDRLFVCIADIIDECASHDRVFLPLLTVLESLLSMDGLLEVCEGRAEETKWLPRIGDTVAKHTLRKRAVRRVTLGIAVQCALLQFDQLDDLWLRAMKRVLVALLHTYPIVRRTTADKLYETLMMFGRLDNHNEVVAALLANTQWHNEDLVQLRVIRDSVAQGLNVQMGEGPRLVKQ